MAKIVLISCTSKKLPYKDKAKNLYISPLFKLSLEYARSLNPERIFILSAKYGLLDLEQEIEPYEKSLNKISIEERKEWARQVISQLETHVDLQSDYFVFLAGKKYREFIVPRIKHYEIPMENLGIGRQLSWLKKHL